jgi:hypothetical protein
MLGNLFASQQHVLESKREEKRKLFSFLSGGGCWVNTPGSGCKTMRSGVWSRQKTRDIHTLLSREEQRMIFVVCSLFLHCSWSFWFGDPHVGSPLTEEQNAQSRNRDAHSYLWCAISLFSLLNSNTL